MIRLTNRLMTSALSIALSPLAVAVAAQAKGGELQGTFRGVNPHDATQTIEIQFVAVNQPSTVSRVAACNFDDACRSTEMESGFCPLADDSSCQYIKAISMKKSTYQPDSERQWLLDYAFADQSGQQLDIFSIETNVGGEDGLHLVSAAHQLDMMLLPVPTK